MKSQNAIPQKSLSNPNIRNAFKTPRADESGNKTFTRNDWAMANTYRPGVLPSIPQNGSFEY